ncbi:GNAT family N-acetyltransferase [Brevibacillus fluminis]|uniref:GNAT family N-acetyltransferase n=1 Tax=Brevibacillus fluminis TaxID=511487 RepID=A0A3M8DR26_9BACL|nr:GNAT family N-acetyltransferase [Brevibacillus fluminis]RNB90414.1 GNAT family N-acetyltransferase [Brevibacillus fluminis]
MDIKLRDYMDADYHEFLEMVSSLYSEDLEGQPMNSTKVTSTINECKKNPQKVRIVILINNNEIIGYSILVYFWSNEYGGNILFIDELYVKEDSRSRGIGAYFLNCIEKMDNIVALQLEANTSNKRVLDYYTRLGFEVVGNTQLIKNKGF